MAGYQQLYDIAELPTYSAAPAGNDQAQAGDAWSRMAAVYQTSKQAAAHTGSFNSETLASQDAAQKRVDSIFKATGVRLANPYNASPLLGDEIDNPQAHEDDRAALKAFAADHPDYQPGKVLDFDQQSKLDPYRKRAFQQRLQDLQRDFPEHAAVIQADRPIEGAAIDLAGQSAANAARAYQSGPGGGLSFLSSLAGGLIASFRDPVQVAALAFGGGEIKAVSTVGRIAEGAIRQGAVNAGIAAIEQPSVQDWRARVGLETGVLPAAEDVGLAFLFGAIPGGALAPFHGGNPARAREGAQNLADALRGDARAVQRATEVLPRDVAPELHAAAESNTLDRAAAPLLPEHLSPETAAPLQRDGVRFAEDPLNDPLPDAFTGGTAERALVLSDAARAMVERGEVEPHVALTVPGLVVDPAGHAAMLQRLQEAGIRDADQARLFISRELDAANMRDAQGAVLPPINVENDIQRRATIRNPELFTRAGTLDAEITAIRANIEALRNEEPVRLGGPHQARIDEIEARLAEKYATGKRKNSTPARALKEELARLKSDQEAALSRIAADQQSTNASRLNALRQHLNDLQSDRARLGPEIRAARDAAAAELNLEPRPAPSAVPAPRVEIKRAADVAAHVSDMEANIAQSAPSPARRPKPSKTSTPNAQLREAPQAVAPASVIRNEPAPSAAAAAISEPGFATVADRGRQAQAMEQGLFGAPPPAARSLPSVALKETDSLFQMLARAGGLKPSGDLKTILGGVNPFVPGAGRLIRKGGVDIDTALRLAEQSGHVNEPGLHGGGVRELTPSDLLDLIDREARGTKVYRMGYEPKAAKPDPAQIASQKANAAAEARDAAPFVRQFDDALRAADIDPKSVDAQLRDDTVRLMRQQGIEDPLIAYERAAMIDRERLDFADDFTGLDLDATYRNAGAREPDIPFDAGPASPGGREPARGEPAARPDGAGGNTGENARAAGSDRTGPPDRLIDAVPVADRVDGSDMRTVARDDLRTAQPRENDLADLVDLCKF